MTLYSNVSQWWTQPTRHQPRPVTCSTSWTVSQYWCQRGGVGGGSKDLVLEQFAKYQITDISSCLGDRVDMSWTEIGRKHDLQVLAKVMAELLTIPHSSAPCERVFSVVRKNATDQRASLSQDTIEALLVLKSKPGHFLDDSNEISDEQLSQLKSCYNKSLKK